MDSVLEYAKVSAKIQSYAKTQSYAKVNRKKSDPKVTRSARRRAAEAAT